MARKAEDDLRLTSYMMPETFISDMSIHDTLVPAVQTPCLAAGLRNQ